jgi:hypothetical protein
MLGSVAQAGPADHFLHTVHHSGEIHARFQGFDPDAGGGAHVMRALRGGDQAL